MTSTQEQRNNNWQWFFTTVLSIGLAMNAYIINKVDSMDKRQNEYIERIKGVEMQQDFNNGIDIKQTEFINNHEQRIEAHEQRLEKLEAILTRNKYIIKR